MGRILEVECNHLEDELIRVSFANCQLVSDHPAQFGGSGSGPMPGEMIQMSLVSGTVLAGRRYAARHGLDVGHVGARASATSVKEGLPAELGHVALSQLIYTERFWRLIEIDGALSDSERDALTQAMIDCRVARTIRAGIDLDKKVICHPSPSGERAALRSNHDGHPLKGRPRMAPGSSEVHMNAGDWKVSASGLDADTCLVKAAGNLCVMGSEAGAGHGPTPEEMLVAGIAACTTIFIARNAAFHEIPVEAVRVRARFELPDDPDEPIRHVEKVSEIVGAFTREEIVKLEGFAGYCAFGVTLARQTPIEDMLAYNRSDEGSVTLPLRALDRSAPTPGNEAFCDDGSCCIPSLVQ